MSSIPSPILRAVQGLAERSGRTVVIAGPPTSGKSAHLEEIRRLLQELDAHVFELRGSYRARSIPFGALDGLRSDPHEIGAAAGSPEPDDGAVPEDAFGVAPIPYLPDRVPRSRRSRGERPRTSFLGQPVRGRSANEGDPDAFWREILPEMTGTEGHPVAIVVDDGALFDTESREFLVALTKRARFRPLLIAVALDTSVAGYISWEEALLGRLDVDWVRIPEGLPDPREAHRLKAMFDDLPTSTQRVVGYVALLGGSVGELVLSRVARLNFPQLTEALLPATGIGLVKSQDGKVSFPHLAWVPLTPQLLPESDRKEMHLQIANALTALSPEPSLARRIELAHHFYAWSRGPVALQQLLDAAEVSLGLLSFDAAEELFAEAISCLPSLVPAERDRLEPELRLLHARALFSAGRLSEGELETREGIATALRAQIDVGTLADWVEPLVLTLRVVGPRPSLTTALVELAERCHDGDRIEIEVLLQGLIAEFRYERNQTEEARRESVRAAMLARRIPGGPLQALALLAVGLSRIEGSPEEQEVAGRFLRAARLLLTRARRWELDHLAGDLEARLLEAQGEAQKARQLRERAIPALQRAKLPSIELSHELGIVQSLLDRGAPKGIDPPLERARTIVETLHLIPPSPGLLRCWLLEGRHLATAESYDAARDRWRAIVDLPPSDTLPRVRAEAALRLTLLELSLDNAEAVAALRPILEEPATIALLPAAWRPLLDDLDGLASRSDHGGGPIPPPEGSRGGREPQPRERRRSHAVRDRDRADDQ